ncbi:hypothetical protein NU08_0106 [Flavobacterium anhuiense]|uniref:Uncharacterized protein n=1 Tax=Flavobacterium anhuiense TaxID=459526 RepID=A0A444W454_9FLAO|nr:hypothetical protein NU08_0106 [Flavobacterium anhuiense]
MPLLYNFNKLSKFSILSNLIKSNFKILITTLLKASEKNQIISNC